MLKRLITLLDVLCVIWIAAWTIAFYGQHSGWLVTVAILIVLVPYGLLRWVLVGSPLPFNDADTDN